MWNPGSAGDSWTSASETREFVRKQWIPISLQVWLDAQFLFFLSPMDNFENLGHCVYFRGIRSCPDSVIFIPCYFLSIFHLEWYFNWHAELCNNICKISLVIFCKVEKIKLSGKWTSEIQAWLTYFTLCTSANLLFLETKTTYLYFIHKSKIGSVVFSCDVEQHKYYY